MICDEGKLHSVEQKGEENLLWWIHSTDHRILLHPKQPPPWARPTQSAERHSVLIFEEERRAVFLHTACGVDVEWGTLEWDEPKVEMLLQRFKEPACSVQTIESLLLLESKDIDELLAPLPMSTRASIRKRCAEGIYNA